ncbi:MAG TPA: hypothetical protein VGH67_11120 [Solirubrobacteraceae bacterium]|jgi:hypothetical protein
MWLVIFVVPLGIIMLIGGLLAGGIYTIVFLPIALIVVVMAGLFMLWGKSQSRRSLPSDRATTAPAQSTEYSNTPPRPSTPDELVDARRSVQ